MCCKKLVLHAISSDCSFKLCLLLPLLFHYNNIQILFKKITFLNFVFFCNPVEIIIFQYSQIVIDMSADFLRKLTSKIKIYEFSYAYLLSFFIK